MKYEITKTVQLSYEQAIEKVTEELKKEGFGVLTTIDIKDTLKKKIDVDFTRYIILGACNPSFAFQTLSEEKNIGLLLPCNVIIYENGSDIIVSAFDPMTITALSDNPKIQAIAIEVRKKLERVITAV